MKNQNALKITAEQLITIARVFRDKIRTCSDFDNVDLRSNEFAQDINDIIKKIKIKASRARYRKNSIKEYKYQINFYESKEIRELIVWMDFYFSSSLSKKIIEGALGDGYPYQDSDYNKVLEEVSEVIYEVVETKMVHWNILHLIGSQIKPGTSKQADTFCNSKERDEKVLIKEKGKFGLREGKTPSDLITNNGQNNGRELSDLKKCLDENFNIKTKIRTRSAPETLFVCALEKDSRVLYYIYEPKNKRIKYLYNGKQKTYHPDFYIYTQKEEFLLEVKGAHCLENKDSKHEIIKEQQYKTRAKIKAGKESKYKFKVISDKEIQTNGIKSIFMSQ